PTAMSGSPTSRSPAVSSFVSPFPGASRGRFSAAAFPSERGRQKEGLDGDRGAAYRRYPTVLADRVATPASLRPGSVVARRADDQQEPHRDLRTRPARARL